MKTQTRLLAGIAVGALLCMVAVAQSDKRTQSANRLTASDNMFVTKALQGNMAEVELGKLGQQRASNDAVKQFAKRMVDDHQKALDELKTIATNQGITVPTTLDAKGQATFDRLSKLNGAEFDRAYMEDMVKDHRTDVAEFKRESEHGEDPAVKSWAAKTLPTLEDHLKMAEQTERDVKK